MSETLLGSVLIILSAAALIINLLADTVFDFRAKALTDDQLLAAKTSLIWWRKWVNIGVAVSVATVSSMLIMEQNMADRDIQQQLDDLSRRVRALENPPPPPGGTGRTISELSREIDRIFDTLEAHGQDIEATRQRVRRILVEMQQGESAEYGKPRPQRG